jgi:pimeloyl-ACP methyl ester carboxylesterase
MSMKTVKTDLLEIAYFDDGPADGWPVLLLHGWPDDAYGMKPVADYLNTRGFRAIVPWLRGFGPTRFRSHRTIRDGRSVALAQDAIDLLDALGIERCGVVGHDWGARAGYNLAALVPHRLIGLLTLGLTYTPNGKFEMPAFDQARLWWYQWLMTTEGGAQKVREDPVGFARMQWETWSPAGWFQEADFAQTAESFRNPDWVAITLHGYRSRWKEEPVDPRYDAQQATIERTSQLAVTTLMLMGCEDRADIAEDRLKRPRVHNPRYETLEGVGHFPAREDTDNVANLAQNFLDEGFANPERDP